jgi:hypothetical protein
VGLARSGAVSVRVHFLPKSFVLLLFSLPGVLSWLLFLTSCWKKQKQPGKQNFHSIIFETTAHSLVMPGLACITKNTPLLVIFVCAPPL